MYYVYVRSFYHGLIVRVFGDILDAFEFMSYWQNRDRSCHILLKCNGGSYEY